MKKKQAKEPSDPVVDAMVAIYQLIVLGLQVLSAIILRSIVNFLIFLDSFFDSDFTAYLLQTYGSWYNNRLVRNALDYEGDTPSHFKVTVESTETITSYLIATVKYEDMTLWDIKSFIPMCIGRGLSINRENIQVQKIDKNHVKVVMYLS